MCKGQEFALGEDWEQVLGKNEGGVVGGVVVASVLFIQDAESDWGRRLRAAGGRGRILSSGDVQEILICKNRTVPHCKRQPFLVLALARKQPASQCGFSARGTI
jgi:hypothetical protein